MKLKQWGGKLRQKKTERDESLKAAEANVEGKSRGGEVTNTAVLSEALITNYDDMKSEFDDLESTEQQEFLDMLGGDLKDNFDKGSSELEMYVNCLDENECGEIVDRLLKFLDRVSPE